MRIEGLNRSGTVSGRSAVSKAGAGGVFAPTGTTETGRSAAMAPLAPMMEVSSILALQGVGDFSESRRRAVKRGATLLDMLEQMKADLLTGAVAPSRLDVMIQQLTSMRERVDPEIDAVIDEIELRVLVELAKIGRFPTM